MGTVAVGAGKRERREHKEPVSFLPETIAPEKKDDWSDEHESAVGDMPKSPSSQYGLKAQEHIDPRGIRVTNGPMR